MFDESLSDASRRSVQRFVLRTAIPREFVINAMINGVIAFFVYRNRIDIPILGWGGLMAMLGPMSLLMPWLTSFFGVFSCAMARNVGIIVPSDPQDLRWLQRALKIALVNTIFICPTIITFIYFCHYFFQHATFNSATAILGISFGSAFIACLIHSYSIFRYMQLIHSSTKL